MNDEESDQRLSSMNSSKELILQLTLEAMDLEQLAAKSREPLRSQYRSKIESLRQATWNEEMKLRKLERAAAASA